MSDEDPPGEDDPFLLNYDSSDLRIASEFLSIWLPFLSRDHCHACTQTLSDRIRSLDPELDEAVKPLNQEENSPVSTGNNEDSNEVSETPDNCDTTSLGSCEDAAEMPEMNDTSEMGSMENGNEGGNGCPEPDGKVSTGETVRPPESEGSHGVRMPWADMVQEDEFEAEEENEVHREVVKGHSSSGKATMTVRVWQKMKLSREEREYIRFNNVKREKDFICLERVEGKIVNILKGLELHTGVFSAVEQKRIVDFVYQLQELGKKGELKACTYAAPQTRKWGKRRVIIQFGCCYNYAVDKHGNPPGIRKNEIGDPMPHLFKVIIRRLVRWHVVPLSCVPDSCVVNIYEEGDFIPPHVDIHDFVRPFCTVSFLSKCSMVFGSKLTAEGAGDDSGSFVIGLPVGSVLVLNGNAADVAKHCVPAVPTKRISITFRKMDESKRPIGYFPEQDLQGLQPLSYENDKPKWQKNPKSKLCTGKQAARRTDDREKPAGRGTAGHHPILLQIQRGPDNRRRVRVNPDG